MRSRKKRKSKQMEKNEVDTKREGQKKGRWRKLKRPRKKRDTE